MIKFEKIKFKNFMSYGNAWTEFDFEAGISRIAGANGSGKSSIISAIYYGLFGKPYNKVLLNHLLNCINKSDLMVELYFGIGEDKYKIERGMKPNKFYIWKNDIIVPVDSATKTYQQVLEMDILNLNENMFNQVVLKSANRDISFLPLKKSEKRKIIENIFDIEFFTVISKLAKSKLDEYDSKIQLNKKDIDYYEILIQQERSNLEQYRNINKKLLKEQRKKEDQINKDIIETEKLKEPLLSKLDKIKEIENKLFGFENKLAELKQTKKELQNELSDIVAKIKLYLSKKEFYDGNCAGCDKLTKIFNVEDLKNLNTIKTDLNKSLDGVTEEIGKQNITIDKAKAVINNRSVLNREIQLIDSKIESLKNSIKEEEEYIEIDDSKLKKYLEDMDINKDRYNSDFKYKSHYNVIKMLFSDEGIKSFLIKKYLPHINKILNSYLQMFGSDILFYFDSEFNETVGSRYKEHFVYDSFSDGQKRRVDLSILFTFMEFCKIKNKKSDTNLLILDEVSSGLDAEGDNRLYSILRDIATKENKCIITVNHSGNIDPEKIDHLYNVDMVKGFSKFTKVLN